MSNWVYRRPFDYLQRRSFVAFATVAASAVFADSSGGGSALSAGAGFGVPIAAGKGGAAAVSAGAGQSSPLASGKGGASALSAGGGAPEVPGTSKGGGSALSAGGGIPTSYIEATVIAPFSAYAVATGATIATVPGGSSALSVGAGLAALVASGKGGATALSSGGGSGVGCCARAGETVRKKPTIANRSDRHQTSSFETATSGNSTRTLRRADAICGTPRSIGRH